MKIFAEIGCLLIMLVSVAQGQASSSDGAIQIMRNGAQASWQAPIEHFTGPARVTPLFQAVAPARASGSLVTFEPGARTAWHVHPLGQILIVTADVGRVQRRGDPAEEIRQGDVAWIPPDQKRYERRSKSRPVVPPDLCSLN